MRCFCVAISMLSLTVGAKPLLQTPSGPLDQGIRNLKDTIAKTRAQADALKDEAQDHLTSIAETIYTTYGQKRDPGRILLEIKGIVNNAQEGVRAGRAGQISEALGRASQLALDLASRDPRIEAVNVLQQVGWELAETRQILKERTDREARIKIDTTTLAWLEEKNEALRSKRRPPPDDTSQKPTKTDLRDDTAPDELLRLQRWLDLGNRGFSSRAEEDRFYRDYPELVPLRGIAETRSPVDEAAEDRLIDKIYEARSRANQRRATLHQEEQEQKQSAASRDDSRRALDQALELERQSEAAGRSVQIPLDRLKRSIPPGWIPCECPPRHPNAGLLIDGQRWHTPAIDCSMVF